MQLCSLSTICKEWIFFSEIVCVFLRFMCHVFVTRYDKQVHVSLIISELYV